MVNPGEPHERVKVAPPDETDPKALGVFRLLVSERGPTYLQLGGLLAPFLCRRQEMISRAGTVSFHGKGGRFVPGNQLILDEAQCSMTQITQQRKR